MKTPTRYWVTTGVGESDVSMLTAIDKAYLDSGLGYQNHVSVSSIPPVNKINPRIDRDQGITFVPLNDEWKKIPFSEVIHVVRAQNIGSRGDNLNSCISLAKIDVVINGENHQSLLAYESTGDNLNDIEQESLAGLKAMIKEREAQIDETWGNTGYETISSSLTISKKYGCSVAFVVFDPFTYNC